MTLSAQHLKQQLRNTAVATQWRGPHRLNIVVVLAVVYSLLGPSGSDCADEPLTLYPFPHPFSPSLISHLASADVKQHVYLLLQSVQHKAKNKMHNSITSQSHRPDRSKEIITNNTEKGSGLGRLHIRIFPGRSTVYVCMCILSSYMFVCVPHHI